VPDPLAVAKAQLRRRMAARREALSGAEAEAAGRAVAALLAACEPFQAAERVALYAALSDELPTRPTFEAVIASERPALLPRLDADGRLRFQRVTSWEELRAGRHGVLEPSGPDAPIRLTERDLVLVPGMAFDAEGHRLGRGGGHYDAAFQPGEHRAPLWGVAYAFQLVESVPHGSRDRPVDAIVTERGVRWAEKAT